MDINVANLAPDLAKLLGIPPSTMILLLMIITTAANVGARVIPDDAKGWKGALRKVCALIGLYVSSRVTADKTVAEVARAALKAQPIPQIVEAEKAEDAKH
jgi:hypothetical protein